MEANQIINIIIEWIPGLEDIEIVPGNGISPHTGYVCFRCRYMFKHVLIKAGPIPKNIHNNLKDEYRILVKLEHSGIVEIHGAITPPYSNVMGIILEDLPYGGRRSRWRNIMMNWEVNKSTSFIEKMFHNLIWLSDRNIFHNDVEFANIGARDTEYAPILFDFGRFIVSEKNIKKELSLNKSTVNNAWAREMFGIGRNYEKEGSMIKDVNFCKMFYDSLVEKING